jgi:type I restriction enzyme S subunit
MKGTTAQTIPAGYKQSEVGVIPEDWEVVELGDSLESCPRYGVNAAAVPYSDRLPIYLRITDISVDGRFAPAPLVSVDSKTAHEYLLTEGDLVFARTGASVGKSYRYNHNDGSLVYAGFLIRVRPDPERLLPAYAAAYVTTGSYWHWVHLMSMRSGQPGINGSEYAQMPIPLPPLSEQRAIAEALSDMDALLEGLERLIAKKRDLKQAAMQQLLTGQIRLPGFSGEWEISPLEALADCLDNVRVPLNESQRTSMKGDYPYCGANGVLDYVNDYVIDDDIILMAEDGGYFDEYESRPIAYRMRGKCWVNNHAHILKAKSGYNQGFLFFSLVHKNILPFLASGTRAKLNKSEMNKIEILGPKNQDEQTAIATILSDMDAEITALEARRDKTRHLKQAMMQELLTGKTRLV